jgi:hypothetical protein
MQYLGREHSKILCRTVKTFSSDNSVRHDDETEILIEIYCYYDNSLSFGIPFIMKSF